MATHKLTDTLLRSLKSDDPRIRIPDGAGLYIKHLPSGKFAFRFDYFRDGRCNTISMGVYPQTSLALARENAAAARQLLAQGIDPSEERKSKKRAARQERINAERRRNGEPLEGTLHAKALAYVKFKSNPAQKNSWSKDHTEAVMCRLRVHVIPAIGHLYLSELTPPILLAVIRKIEAAEKFETASRVLEHCSCICRFAIAEGLMSSDPCRDLRGALITPDASNHFAAILKPPMLADFIQRANCYSGLASTRLALILNVHLFRRSNELRNAVWSEFDLENSVWSIPSQRMKGTRAKKNLNIPHLVPLSSQVVEMLRDWRELNPNSKFVFPNAKGKALTGETLTKALRRLGYAKEEVSIHGFRSTAHTLLSEVLGYDSRIIDAQLAHVVDNPLGDAYARSTWMLQRGRMMQAWSDYIERISQSQRFDAGSFEVNVEALPSTALPFDMHISAQNAAQTYSSPF